MRYIIMLLFLSSTIQAATLTTSTTGNWVRDTDTPFTLTVNHVYDSSANLTSADFSWEATPFTRETYKSILIPGEFPEPPRYEIVATVSETLRLLEWNATAVLDEETVGPYFDPNLKQWLLSTEVPQVSGHLLVERTLEGPETTTTEILSLRAVDPGGGRVRHKYNDLGEWIPLTHDEYILHTIDDFGPFVPTTIHDGVTISGYYLTSALPVVPEPTASWLYLVLLIAANRHRIQWQRRMAN